MASPRGRTGRPPRSDSNNRDRILDAARNEFAAHGFDATGLRSIATRAGVDVALIAHYFGSKNDLFVASIELPEGALAMIADVLAAPAAERGERLTRGYLELWERPETSAQVRVLGRSALTNEAAAARMRDLLTGVLADPQVTAAFGPQAVGLSLAAAHLVGVAFARHLIGVPVLAEVELDRLVEIITPTVQRYLTEVE